MAGRIRKLSGIAGSNRITKMLCLKEETGKRTLTENVNEIKGLEDDDTTTCRTVIERLMEKMDHLTNVVKQLSRENIAIKEALNKSNFRPMPWESDISSSQQRIFYLEWKLDAIEKGMRRNNIVITGLEVDETNVQESVRLFLKYMFERSVIIQRARLMKRIGKTPRIIVTLSRFEDKKRILAEAEILKGTGVFINSQETTYDRDIRRQLKIIADDEMEKGKTVSMGYRKLVVDGVEYIWKPGVGLEKVEKQINDEV